MKRLIVPALLVILLALFATTAWAALRPHPDYPHLHLCIPGADRDVATCDWPPDH